MLDPWLAALSALLLVIGLGWGFGFAPADYQQGKATGSCTFTSRRRCGRWGCTWRWPSRPSSGWSGRSKWPTWRSPPWRRWGGLHPGGAGQRRGMGQADVGTWWIWDARLTSELVLLFLYAGVIALWHAFDDRRLAGRAAGILVLVGGGQSAHHSLLGLLVEHPAPGLDQPGSKPSTQACVCRCGSASLPSSRCRSP